MIIVSSGPCVLFLHPLMFLAFQEKGQKPGTAECNVQGRRGSLLELVLGKAFLWAKNTTHDQLAS